MIEHEKDILEKLGKALPHMSEFDKGYLTRMAEESARQAVDDEKKSKEACKLGLSFNGYILLLIDKAHQC